MLRLETGVEAERNADADGHHQRGHRQLQGGRHALQDHRQRRLAENEGAAEVALQRAAHEVEVLLPDRAIEAQRADRRLDVALVHLRIDQQPDRIADHVHAEEHDHRHDDDDHRSLHQAA